MHVLQCHAMSCLSACLCPKHLTDLDPQRDTSPLDICKVILYHDLVLQHPSFSSALVQRRAKSSKAGELSLLQLKGPGSRLSPLALEPRVFFWRAVW